MKTLQFLRDLLRSKWWLFNWLPKDLRYWGYRDYEWNDGPIYTLGFWFFNCGIKL